MRRLIKRSRTVVAALLVLVCVTEIQYLWRPKVQGKWLEGEKSFGIINNIRSTASTNNRPLVTPQPRKANKSSGNPKKVAEKPRNHSTSNFLDDVIADLSSPWTANKTRQITTRKRLNSVIDAREFAILTKKFSEVGQDLIFALNPQISRNLTQEIYDMLPEESPFADLKFKRCSVVGNSGILTKSNCGDEINKHDYVFRCNTPPIQGHRTHAGTKANISSINPSGVINNRYKRLKDIGKRNRFLADMKSYEALLFPLYGVNPAAYTTSLLALRLLRQKEFATRPLIINPDHFKKLQNMWRKMGLKSRMTTGFYLASVALSVCNSTDLYGFWPFNTDTSHQPLAYHYYDELKITTGAHNFSWEFDRLHQMHTEGVLRLHVGPCKLPLG